MNGTDFFLFWYTRNGSYTCGTVYNQFNSTIVRNTFRNAFCNAFNNAFRRAFQVNACFGTPHHPQRAAEACGACGAEHRFAKDIGKHRFDVKKERFNE